MDTLRKSIVAVDVYDVHIARFFINNNDNGTALFEYRRLAHNCSVAMHNETVYANMGNASGLVSCTSYTSAEYMLGALCALSGRLIV